MPTIIGLEKQVENPATGASAGYHVVRSFAVDLVAGTSAVTLGSFFSRAAHEAGKQALAHVTVPLKAVPAGDLAEVPAWFYAQVAAPDAVSVLAGAVAVVAQDLAQ